MPKQSHARLWLAISLAGALSVVAPRAISEQDAIEQTAPSYGCVRTTGRALKPDRTDLKDGVTHYGVLARCTDGRPAILTIDLVEYYEGEQAIREAAKDGETLERDVDPVMFVRNRNPKLRRLGVKPDAEVLMFDCEKAGCEPRRAHLAELPWNAMYRFRLQNGLIVYIELPYTP